MDISEDQVNSLSDLALAAWADNVEHRYESDDEGDLYHQYWDCVACMVEKEQQRRRVVAEAKEPGGCTLLSGEGKGVISHNILASELRKGYQARYLPRPGVSDYPSVYAEALEVENTAEGVVVTWRQTNSPKAPTFTVVYEQDEDLNVIHYL